MPSSTNPVVLLHGLGRTSASLRRLARGLEVRGHVVFNLDYPSRRRDVRACGEYLRPVIVEIQERYGTPVSFVGHSMGGLVARSLAAAPDIRPDAIVMLASPNGGSEVADHIYRYWLGRLVFGPALDCLRTTKAHALPPPACPIGIIAGTRSYLPFTASLIHGLNDGLVSVERSKLDGADWIALEAGHTFLMNHPAVPDAVASFLREGRFPVRHRTDNKPP